MGARRVGGVRERVRDGETGLLVPPGDAEALASAIEETWEDPAATRTRVERAYDFAMRELDIDKKMEETLRVYKKVQL